MSEDMVERVAKAIRDTNANTVGLTFTELSEAMARAAIEAMREPTPEMMQAYVHAFVSKDRFEGEKVYGQMIDAALGGKP